MMSGNAAFATREGLARQIQAAFVEAELGTRFANDKREHHAEVTAYQNFDAGGQRRIFVRVWDDGVCRVHITKILQIPIGMADRVDVGEVPLLFELPSSTPDLGREVRQRVRQASLDDSEIIPAILLDDSREPPIPVGQLETLADLIQAFHDQYRSETYARALETCLRRVGTVVHRGRREEWFMTETDRGVYRRLGEGEMSRGTDAEMVRLSAVIPEFC